jgi:heat shock protein HslJ
MRESERRLVMRMFRIVAAFILLLFCVSLQAQTQEKELTVVGKLVRVMGIGGETTGWAIETESGVTVEGKKVNSVEVSYADGEMLGKLADKRVEARGKITHRHGVERADWPVLEITSIQELPGKAAAAEATPFSLTGREWVLEDLGGNGVLDNVQSTLEFPESGKAVGISSCNRFFGTVEVKGESIKFGPMASSRRACPEGVMNQETKYLAALQAAERYEWRDPYLLIYCKGMEKPLRFTQVKTEEH